MDAHPADRIVTRTAPSRTPQAVPELQRSTPAAEDFDVWLAAMRGLLLTIGAALLVLAGWSAGMWAMGL